MKPTYKQQFDKLTEAYIHMKVNPFNGCECFIGNLLGGREWEGARFYINEGMPVNELLQPGCQNAIAFISRASDGLYSAKQIIDLESVFMQPFYKLRNKHRFHWFEQVLTHPEYEEILFQSFVTTLECLKEIHRKSGENVDQLTFKKRKALV